MIGDRIKKRTYLGKGWVDSVEDHCLRIPTRVSSFARFDQCGLPILKLRNTRIGSALVARNPMWNENLHHHLIILKCLHRQVKSVHGALQRCLKVNAYQIIQSRLNVHLDKGTDVAFHRAPLLGGCHRTTWHTALCKHWPTWHVEGDQHNEEEGELIHFGRASAVIQLFSPHITSTTPWGRCS